MKPIIESPRGRIDGKDSYAVQRTSVNIMRAMEEMKWTEGEAELLPEYLKDAIEKNKKRRQNAQPFIVREITQE